MNSRFKVWACALLLALLHGCGGGGVEARKAGEPEALALPWCHRV